MWAVADLHVSHAENRPLLDRMVSRTDDDWLVVAGDVAETVDDIALVLHTLADRFATVVWVPGNHELWTTRADRTSLRGQARYEMLVRLCRRLGVLTPEDPFPVWRGADGPVTVAPLFTLYDYSWLAPGTADAAASLAYAHGTGVVCTDEALLHPDPHPDRAAWCRERVAVSEARLAAVSGPTLLVSHWPLVREPTQRLRHPEFAQWCGTEATRGWPRRFGAVACVHGHLHIPRDTVVDGITHHEVSIGYPREWQRFGLRPDLLRPVLH
ncbi:metallophosphoesterase family protein [Rhodococcus aerolatus]